jgi:uncharacterized protein DUF6263
MIKCGLASRPATLGAKIQPFARLTWFFSLAIAVLFTVAATPPTGQENPDELYIRIMAMIDRADALRTSGQTEAARAKYAEAEKALLYFKATNPLFAPKTVAYRIKEVTERADARPPIAEPAETPKTNLEASSPSAKSGVKLIDAGAEPRTALRYHLKAGDKQVVIMTMKVKMDMSMPAAAPGGTPPAMPAIPAITIPMDMTVQSVAANGDITYESVMGEADIKAEAGTTPEVAQAMKTALAGMKGLSSTGVMSNRGVTKKFDMKAPATADAQARQLMDLIKEGTSNLNVPFPEEPVGVGAKWETKKVNKIQTTSVEQNATYELVSAQGDQLSTKFNAAFNATAPKTAAANQMASPQMSGNMNGTANLDLSKLVGPSANIDMHMEAPMPNNQSRKTDMTVALEAH